MRCAAGSIASQASSALTGAGSVRKNAIAGVSSDWISPISKLPGLRMLATLKIGLDILTEQEQVRIDKLYGHGGFFKTPGVGQRMLSAAVGAPVSVMETAGEGGPYGMALLAAYLLRKQAGESLEDYLDNKVFAGAKTSTLMADGADVEGFNAFLARYRRALPLERAAIETIEI